MDVKKKKTISTIWSVKHAGQQAFDGLRHGIGIDIPSRNRHVAFTLKRRSECDLVGIYVKATMGELVLNSLFQNSNI